MSMKNGSPRREFGSSRANIHKNPETHRLIDLTMDSTSEGGYSESDEPVFAVKDFLGPQRHRRVIMPPGNEVNGAKGHQAIVIDSSPPHVSHVNGSATERSESRLESEPYESRSTPRYEGRHGSNDRWQLHPPNTYSHSFTDFRQASDKGHRRADVRDMLLVDKQGLVSSHLNMNHERHGSASPHMSTLAQQHVHTVSFPSPEGSNASLSISHTQSMNPTSASQAHKAPPFSRHSSHHMPASSHREGSSVGEKQTPGSFGMTTPSFDRQFHNGGGASLQHTPTEVGWTTGKIARALEERTQDLERFNQDLVAFTIKSVEPTEKRVLKGTDWFSCVKHDPVPVEVGNNDMIKIKVKHHGRSKKEQRTFHFMPICIKTERLRVPKYRFHHKEIARNVLTPNTMLKFVPHIRDLEANEERNYNLWLKELERMDASCGFQPMGTREQRVIRTAKKERTAMLALYLDYWLGKLAIPDCTRTTLIRHMASNQSDMAITPLQKSSLYGLHRGNGPADTPQAALSAKMFTEAFNQVFHDGVAPERAVSLRDILLLDKSVDDIVESKKTAKTATQDDAKSPEAFLETYAIMGCLICYSNSCEHGDYGENNEKRNFSLDCNGQLEQLLTKSRDAHEKNDADQTIIEPCSRECFILHGDGSSLGQAMAARETRPWSASNEALLKSLFSSIECSGRVRSKPQCMAAEILNRACWDVHRQLKKLDIQLPEDTRPELPRVKNLPWYDRHKKVLLGDWQEHTDTHDHRLRYVNDPCHHDGPCTAANGCKCVIFNVLCERFCRCTAECCAYKFTGCACAGSGKTCQQRNCICVQLNRECDPQLCGTCGVIERAHPDNRDNESIMETGCQNCALQRGHCKAVTPGKSQLDGCGYGLFTLEDIAQHEFVIEYTGELIMHDEGVRREARRGEVFDEGSFTSYVFSLLDSEGIWVDAAIYGNHSRYINHEQDTYNVEPKILYVNGEYRIRFSATRNIQAGEELFFNYGNNFPNLTKKMIKDKTAEEDGPATSESLSVEPLPAKKTRVQGGSTRGRGRGGTRGRGRGRGVGRGRGGGRGQATKSEPKPVKRGRLSARKEAPQMPEEGMQAASDLAIPTEGRKRKRDLIEDSEEEEEEEEDYEPTTVDEESDNKTDTQVAEAEKGKQTRGDTRRRSRRRLESPVQDDDEETTEMNTPTRGRARQRQSASTSAGWLVNGSFNKQVTPLHKRRGRHPNKATEDVKSNGDSAKADDSPSQPKGRKSKSALKANTPRRGGDEADDYIDDNDMDNDDHDEAQATPTPVLRTRRSRRFVASDSDDEAMPFPGDTYVDEDSIGSRLSGGRSDSRSRRERKMPARYRDREIP